MIYIGKSYLQLSKEEKDYFIDLYYKNKNMTVNDIGSKLGLSKRCTMSIFKELGINSKRKNRYILNENYFDNIDTPEKSYILGLIYADGYVGSKKFNNLAITQNNKDILEQVKRELEFTGDIRKGNKGSFENSKEGYVLNFSSEQIAKKLRELGLYPGKSLTISQIPNIDKSLKRHFLRGYFDGDGSISSYIHTFTKSGKNYSYHKGKMCIIATENMLKDFINTFNIEKYHISNSKTEQMKYIQIESKSELLKMYNLMYDECTICNKSKKEKWENLMSAII